MVGCVCHNGVEVTVDLCVAKSEEAATTGSQVARQRQQWGLASLRRHGVRDHVVERGGSLRTWHVGERLLKDSAMLVRKEMKKIKKHICTACLQMALQEMVAVGVAAKGRRWWCGGLYACRRGCDHPSCVGHGGGPRATAAGVVAIP